MGFDCDMVSLFRVKSAMPQLLPIGSFAIHTGISKRMLRFYEDIGLLLPAHVNPENGYRYYHYSQALEAAQIKLLRSLDMPLEEIRQLLHSEHTAQRTHLLHYHYDRIAQRISEFQHALTILRQLEDHQGNLYPVQEIQLPEVCCVVMPFTVQLSEVDRVRMYALSQLTSHLQQHGHILGPGFARVRYPHDPAVVEPDMTPLPAHQKVPTFQFEVGIPAHTTSPVPEDMDLQVWPARTVLQTVHHGPYDAMHLATRALRQHASLHHLTLRPHHLEIYQTGPLDTIKKDALLTLVQYEIQTD